MAIKLYVNPTSYANSTSTPSAYAHVFNNTLQDTGAWNGRSVTHIYEENGSIETRLFQDSSGCYQISEKPPGEAIGEGLLLLWNKLSGLPSYMASFSQYVPSFSFLPGAHAIQVSNLPTTIQFPSNEELFDCLNREFSAHKHKKVIPRSAKEIIIDKFAKSFANRTLGFAEVDVQVELILQKLNEKLSMPSISLDILRRKLIEILTSCGNGDGVANLLTTTNAIGQ